MRLKSVKYQLFGFVILLVALNFCVLAQTKERRMILDDNSCDQPKSESKDEDSNCLVELKEVSIGNEKIISGKPFNADENWLKNLKVRIKNVSGKPIVAVAFRFCLIEGLYQELAPSASWSWCFPLTRGNFSDPNDKKRKISKVIVLKTNEEIELTYNDLPNQRVYNVYRSAEFEQVVRNWQQIVITTATVEFKNGKQDDSFLFFKKEQK